MAVTSILADMSYNWLTRPGYIRRGNQVVCVAAGGGRDGVAEWDRSFAQSDRALYMRALTVALSQGHTEAVARGLALGYVYAANRGAAYPPAFQRQLDELHKGIVS
jgi:hypothetical protein